MLESYFKRQTYLCELRQAPFGSCLEGFSSELERLGYARKTARRILWKIGEFNKYSRHARVGSIMEINKELISRFLKKTRRSKYMIYETSWAINHFLKYLRLQGLIQTPVIEGPKDAFDDLISRYDSHLVNVRGLSSHTRESYLRGARRLYDWLKSAKQNKAFEELTGADVLEFISDFIGMHLSVSWRLHIGADTRAFLRYLRWEGIIKTDLARVVPPIPCRRLSNIPRHLCWDQVRKVIASVETNSAFGKRDKAILLLLAMLGLRNQEVRKLRLGDIDWRAGKIHLLKTKSQRERILPLGQEVGDALADYLLTGRPRSSLPYVFLRHMPPIAATHAIAGIVRRRLKRAGIESPSYGAYVLRHSLATHLVNREVPIKHIADVLGHASIDTTSIYTKVNYTQLATVARPFPGAAL